jgi:glycosyltransferase involved in cell wall biosynthesis
MSRPAPDPLSPAASATSARVDVVLPAYSGAKVIRRAIESALAQEVPLRIIVVDDGSPDDSADIARSYGDRITVIRQANRGVSGARNTGLAAANAPYVALLDQDDIWMPGKLRRQVAVLDAHADVGLVFTDMRIESADGRAIEDGFLANTAPYAALDRTPVGERTFLLAPELATAVGRFNFISPSTVLARREALAGIGGFDEAFRLCDDAECWMRLFGRWRGAVIEERLVRSLMWEGNASWMADKLLDERIRIGDKAAARPELYAPGTAEYFRTERPLSLYRLGVIAMNGGDVTRARRLFAASLRDRWSLTAALGLGASWMPSPLRVLLLRAKRATGARWAMKIE